MYLIFDTETTGLPRNWNAPITDTDNWPRCVQLAWQVHDEWGELVEVKNYIIRPEGYTIPFNAEKIHGISTEMALKQGMPLGEVLAIFKEALSHVEFVVGHNVGFDISVMGSEYVREGQDSPLKDMLLLDSCTEATATYCQLPGGRGGKFKLPTLTELHEKLFGEPFNEAHNASADVEATTRAFLELIRRGIFTADQLHRDESYLQDFKAKNPRPFELIGLNIQPYSPSDYTPEKETGGEVKQTSTEDHSDRLTNARFAHLHNHTQYSILQSTIEVGTLIEKTAAYKMPAVAMTDTGNMMAAFHFVQGVASHNARIKKQLEDAGEDASELENKLITPIVGCEFFICQDHTNTSVKDNGFQVVLLAKNKRGYHNLAKMASIAATKGFYYVPRIDKKVVEMYKEDIICLTGNLYGEVPSTILNVGEAQAEEALLWWKSQFGDDLYIELMRHGLEEENHVNRVLLDFAAKHNVKYIASNNTYYTDKGDANAHDILLCVKDGERQSTPKGKGRGFRYGLSNDEFYFKSQEEMKELFKDLPEAIENIQDVIDKCEPFELARDVLLPKFDIPQAFIDPADEIDGGNRGENAYLRHLTYLGAEKRYGDLNEEVRERLDFELETIERTGYPGYFLIVQDFTSAARDMGVSVGPGRGSAAGSAVAYCIGITNVDPIKYDLLFERFLNPDRVSLPDIDIDFDDEGRGRIIDWVVNKYGENQVAQIITYGTMAAKSAIRDTGRVLELPLPDTDRVAKLVPDIKLRKLFAMSKDELKGKLKNNSEDLQKADELLKLAQENSLEGKTVNQARIIEGSLRNTGIHACGVIITPDDITNFVPVAKAKDSNMWCTQFDNSVVESAGLLKMDFLGLKTLTLIKDACAIIKRRHGLDLDPDEFPLDDEKTYELFQRGETVGIFQYESAGMQKYMRELKPTTFADLIAMNALYRPGPLEYIPSFIKRKHGQEEIAYDLPDMEEYLEETYGITVYQEQVMLLSQKLAGFTKGEADTLRKAMGKKKIDLLEMLKPKFLDQGEERGHPRETLEKVWKDWEAFASYAFNKSHSTCYAWVAYQTAYLKANYPAEYMASVLSNNMSDIKQVTLFMDECRRMGTPVLGPDVNESQLKFTVNQNSEIRFGLGALKGVGDGAVRAIVNEREESGDYASVFDMVRRIDLRSCNKKAFESLALGGAFDSMGDVHRAQFFAEDNTRRIFLESLIKYGQNQQESENSAQVSLFGEASEVKIPEPTIPPAEPWKNLETLKREREVVGVYISGHPLDDYKLEIKHFCNSRLADLSNINALVGRDIKLAGIVSEFNHRTTKTGKPFGTMTLEDYDESYQLFLFGDDYLKFKEYMMPDWFLFIQGKAQRRKWGDTDQCEFKVHKMELLSELNDKIAQSLEVNLNIQQLDSDFLNELEGLFEKHKGKCRLRLNVYEPDEKISVKMMSKTTTVGIDRELIETLERNHLQYKLN